MKSSHLEHWMKFVFGGCAILCIVCVGLICWFLFTNGLPAMMEIGPFRFLFSSIWKPAEGQYGILCMIAGSLYLGIGAIVLVFRLNDILNNRGVSFLFMTADDRPLQKPVL